MKYFFSLCVVLLAGSCKKDGVEEKDLSYLNGYWEIMEVSLPDGSKKEYTVNPSIDFIQLENRMGFRRKLKPNFNGTYDASNRDMEKFNIKPKNETFLLIYDNEFDQWEEELVELDSLFFSVVNQEGIKYSYKRFQPIAIPK